jgi:hypothetical protein
MIITTLCYIQKQKHYTRTCEKIAYYSNFAFLITFGGPHCPNICFRTSIKSRQTKMRIYCKIILLETISLVVPSVLQKLLQL